MRKKREQESDQHRSQRLAKHAQGRLDDAEAEESAIDVAIRKSIKEFGA